LEKGAGFLPLANHRPFKAWVWWQINNKEKRTWFMGVCEQGKNNISGENVVSIWW
jgi:hypothetical protein